VDDKYRELWAVLLALGLGELLQFSVHVLLELSQGVSVQISCADYADLPRYSLKRRPGIIDLVLENNSQSPGPRSGCEALLTITRILLPRKTLAEALHTHVMCGS
jgi:hypothetical protein